MLLPALALILGIFAWGLFVGLFQSFGYIPALGKSTFTLEHYKVVFTTPGLWNSLCFSLCTAFIASLLSIISGVYAAFLIQSAGEDSWVSRIMFKLPVAVPHTVAALIIYTLFSQSGFLSRILYHIGLIESTTQAPLLIFDKSGMGIILAYLWKSAPFAAMVCFSTLQKIDRRMLRAARTLGAGSFQLFYTITLPLLMPTILSVFIILFSYSFGTFEIPYLLGPSQPQTLPEYSYTLYTSLNLEDRAKSMVVNVLIIAVTLFLVWFYSLAIKKIMGTRNDKN